MECIKFRELEVSRIGLGAMGMSHGYTGPGTDEAESVRTLHQALELGVTLIDTAEIYDPYTSEELLGQALTRRRDQVVPATRFGLVSAGEGPWNLDSSLADIRTAVEGLLKRLGTDRIDRNLRLADEVQAVAAEAGVTPAQVAPALATCAGRRHRTRPRPAPSSRNRFLPCSTAPSSRAASSIRPSHWTKSPRLPGHGRPPRSQGPHRFLNRHSPGGPTGPTPHHT